MRIHKYSKILTLLLLLFGGTTLLAQQNRTEISVDFRVNSTVIDTAYSNNASNIKQILSFLQEVSQDPSIDLLEVSFCGAASPEGSYQLNRKLAQGRIAALEKIVRSKYPLPDSIITRNNSYIPWDNLKAEVIKSSLPHKEEILKVLDQKESIVAYQPNGNRIDNRILELKKIAGGTVWTQMNRMFFSRLRNAAVIFITYRHPEEEKVEETVFATDTLNVAPVAIPVKDTIPAAVPEEPEVSEEPATPVYQWHRHLYAKTNLLGLGLAIANAAVEIDLFPHLSFSLPVYYSAWDYFKTTIKFRTLSTYPELRYWFNRNNDRLFLGAHFGMAYYNYALDGDYRYQDHNRETPSLGGGLSVGYRLPLSRNQRWKMEFTVGGGVYTNHYDIFYNTPVTEDGLMRETVNETYYGLDQATVSIAYMFNLKRKGGRR